jgi:hypothetical protein
MKRLFISQAEQQPLVNTVMLTMEIGLGVLSSPWQWSCSGAWQTCSQDRALEGRS